MRGKVRSSKHSTQGRKDARAVGLRRCFAAERRRCAEGKTIGDLLQKCGPQCREPGGTRTRRPIVPGAAGPSPSPLPSPGGGASAGGRPVRALRIGAHLTCQAELALAAPECVYQGKTLGSLHSTAQNANFFLN